MKKTILLFVLLVFPQFAEGQQIGTITKWQMETFSQSADITRNHVVYFLDFDGKHYKIARKRREEKPTFQPGDHLQIRVEKGFCYATGRTKKEEKYEILSVE